MSFFTDVIKKDARYKTLNTVKDMNLLEPVFKKKVLAFLDEAKSLGHDLRVAETFRSQARQVHLFHQGFTQLKTVGVHNYGLAADFNLFIDGKYEEDGEKYAFFQTLAKKHKLISGIDWGTPRQKHSFHDWDHLQGVPVFRQGGLFRGEWYPSGDDYDPWADQLANHIG